MTAQQQPRPGPVPRPASAADRALTARMEPFDSFWEGPANIEKGYASFFEFYRRNYLPHLPEARGARILVVSCGPGYMVETLTRHGYTNVLGIDSDPEKVAWATKRSLPCRVARAFPFLAEHPAAFDAIFCEQELNHLTKEEMLDFLALAREALAPGGTLVVHGLNGANPITGAEALAQNFDHYNTFTEYTVRQVLEHTGFEDVRVLPLNLYVFYKNPLNWVAWGVTSLLHATFRALFVLYGKHARIFTKKIGAVARRPAA